MLKKNRNLKSIIISGYFGFGNCGDEAILMAMIQQLSQIVSKENIVVLSQNPKKTKMLYGVNSVFRLNPFLIFRQMKKCTVFISGGGGLLQDVSGKGLSIIYYISLILLARLFKIPNVIYGQGIGPIRRGINKKIIKLTLSKTNLIIVRDEQSKILLQQIGIEKKPILVYADSSFLLKKERISSEMEKYYSSGSRNEKSIKKMTIGVVIRKCKEIEQDYNQKVLQLAKVADHLITKYQSRLIFIPFQIDNDLTLLNDVFKQMKNSSVDCLKGEINPAQMLSLFSELSLIIGMRFHAILFATISNKPFIAIDYDPKVRNFVNSLELPELLLNLNQLTIKYIDYKLQYINDNWGEIKSILDTNAKLFQGKAEAGMKELLSFIKEKIL